jgi:hypothetical protein
VQSKKFHIIEEKIKHVQKKTFPQNLYPNKEELNNRIIKVFPLIGFHLVENFIKRSSMEMNK